MMHKGETSTYALKPIWRVETALFLFNDRVEQWYKHLHVIKAYPMCEKYSTCSLIII